MGYVSRSKPGRSDPEEWREGMRRAQAARKVVAKQVSDIIVTGELTGSRGYLAMRVREVAEAAEVDDPMLLRGSLVELAAAGGVWAAAVDLSAPLIKMMNGNGNGHAG